MYKFVVLSILVLGCSARPYTASYGGAAYGSQTYLAPQKVALVGGYGSSGLVAGSGLALNSGLIRGGQLIGSSGLALGQSSGLALSGAAVANNNFGLLTLRQGQAVEPVVSAAIQQLGRTVEYRTVPNVEQPIQAQVIEVEPSDNPVHLHFKTRSSTLSLSQSHTPAAPQEVQTASAQDEPARLITEVQKPVIQEVREVISPYRQVTQEINPVQESLHTVVTKGEGQRAQYSGAQIGAQYANKYAAVQAAPAVAVQSAYVAPAVQSAYVAPAVQSAYVAPAVQSAYVAPAVQSAYVAPALQTSYVAAAPAQAASFQTSYIAKPVVKAVESGYAANTASVAATSEY